jgi:hypothetical protein
MQYLPSMNQWGGRRAARQHSYPNHTPATFSAALISKQYRVKRFMIHTDSGAGLHTCLLENVYSVQDQVLDCKVHRKYEAKAQPKLSLSESDREHNLGVVLPNFPPR